MIFTFSILTILLCFMLACLPSFPFKFSLWFSTPVFFSYSFYLLFASIGLVTLMAEFPTYFLQTNVLHLFSFYQSLLYLFFFYLITHIYFQLPSLHSFNGLSFYFFQTWIVSEAIKRVVISGGLQESFRAAAPQRETLRPLQPSLPH